MHLRRAAVLAVLMLCWLLTAVPPSPVGAEPAQFRLFDQHFVHKVNASAKANYASPPDWTAPVQSAEGRAFLRFSVTKKPSNLPARVQLCMWRNNFTQEACSATFPFSGLGVHWFDLGRPSSWWKTGGWGWGSPFDQSALMIKDAATGSLLMTSACGVNCYSGTEDLMSHTPIEFDASVIVVGPGGQLLPPPSWSGCPAAWSPGCGGGPVNLPPVIDAGPDRFLAQGAGQAAVVATASDDGGADGLSVSWEKVDGPGPVSFSPVNALATRAQFGAPGRYTLQVAAADGSLRSSDRVVIVVPSGPGLVPIRSAQLIVSNVALPTGADRALRDHLRADGWSVQLSDDNLLSQLLLEEADVVIVSASVNAGLLPQWLPELTTPVLSSKGAAQPLLRLGSTPRNRTGQTRIDVVAPSDPLAAGLTGTQVTSAKTGYSGLALPAPGATVVARLAGRQEAAIFRIDEGAALTSGVAPARRVGFFLGPQAAGRLNATGWSLLDSALDWLAPPPETPSGGPTVGANWWDAQWGHRLRLDLTATGGTVEGFGEAGLDFSSALGQVDGSGPFDPASLRVVEVDASGVVRDASVPFQFDPAPGFDAADHAVGTVLVQLTGATGIGEVRHFDVYFEDVTAAIAAAPVAQQVSVEDGVSSIGQGAVRITTPSAVWTLQKENGGLASIQDSAGNDWLSFNSAAGAAGAFRGVPNAVFPEGHFHPGFTGASTTLLHTGPLRFSALTETADGWRARWDIYPSFAVFTMLQSPTSYWFLYEGTPGGQIDLGSDRVLYSDGTDLPLSGSRSGDLPGPEWVAFADTIVGRSLFLSSDTEDTLPDTYSLMQGKMTVFGFGRTGLFPKLYGERSFRLGLVPTVSHPELAAAVEAASAAPSVAMVSFEISG